MDLYFSPLACSLASRIALYEAGLSANYINVKTKVTPDGKDFSTVNTRGQVPALRADDGELVTENVAVLEYIADLAPAAKLAPSGRERVRMRKWLALINSELHVGVLGPMLSPKTPDATKAFLKDKAIATLTWIDGELAGRTWLTDQFTVADAYLAVVANWTQALPIDLKQFPNVTAHKDRVFARPAAGRALAEELVLYRAAA
jgi:glutathione S-transferase